MKQIIYSLIALAIGFGQSYAVGQEPDFAPRGKLIAKGGTINYPDDYDPDSYASKQVDLLIEKFTNVHGSREATDPIDQSQFDNPSGWTFTNAYAGPECIIIKKGGSITTPPIEGITGNAAYSFTATLWEDPTGKTPTDWDAAMIPHVLSLSGRGELWTTEFDMMTSHMGADVMYDVDSTTRLTFTASSDIMLSYVTIYYAGFKYLNSFDYTTYSHKSGEYYNPFDLTLTKCTSPLASDDGKHNILIYTIDGSAPQRDSQRYDGSPIRISETTTVRTATIFGDGSLVRDEARVYTFPTAYTPEIPANTFEVTVSKPGNLKAQLLDLDADVIEGLILKGQINGVDLKYLIDAEGRAAKLSYLDLENITFDYDGSLYSAQSYGPPGGMGNTATYYYYLSETNSDEWRGSGPTHTNYYCYRNNLAHAFTNSNIVRIVAPKILTSIGESAFSGVRMATIPDGVEEIGNDALSNCENVNLPTSIKKIGNYAFGRNLIISELDLPNLEYLGDGAFGGAKLSSFKFHDKLVHIGKGAFASTKLYEAVFTMPGDTIPEGLFADCTDLNKVVIGGDVKVLEAGAFKNCDNITEFSIPQSIEEVGPEAIPDHLLDEPEDGIIYVCKAAYKRTEDKSEFTIKDGTVSLNDELFAYTSLSKITLPSTLRKIGDGAFMSTKLTSTPEMSGVKHIGDQAFMNCTDLARAIIPESVEYIGSSVFEHCDALWSVTYNAINADCPNGVSPRDLERIVIGDKVRRLPRGLYTRNTNVTEVILPSSVEILDPHVFSGCTNLKYVRLADNITTISEEAFYECRELADLHWPAKLKRIGGSAFRGCKSLKTISLPEGVESVDYGAFSFCTGVETLYFASTITELGYGAFTLYQENGGNITITATAETPQDYEWEWSYVATPIIKVPAAYLAAYQADPNWNGSKKGKNNQIIPIEGISAPVENTETTFNNGISTDTDLTDTVIGDVYVTIGEEDGYDETDGSIVLNSTMDEEYAEAIGGMAPGKSDIANRFNGMVVQVPAGHGTVTVDCLTLGNKRVSVKIGEEVPEYHTKDTKGDITVDYNVAEDTYVYIYASEAEAAPQAAKNARGKAPAADNCVKIYSIGVNPGNSGIEGIEADSSDLSPIQEYYRIDGIRVNTPTTPGIYIGRRADGTSTKILIK